MNKLIIVTGGTGGIARCYCRAMLYRGYDIVFTYRNEDAGLMLKSELQSEFPDNIVDAYFLKLECIESIKKFAKKIRTQYNHLDVLVHNAGIYFFDDKKRLSQDGIELNMAVHVVAPYVLTMLLLPLLRETPDSKVICVSSSEHKKARIYRNDIFLRNSFEKIGNVGAYANSKLCSLLFAFKLNRSFHKAGITTMAMAVHPGVSKTGIHYKNNPKLHQRFLIKIMGKIIAGTPEDGASPCVLATVRGYGGEYYGPTNFTETKGKPGLVRPSIMAYDKDLALDMWTELEEITGISVLK